jgi:hypothetical protein
MIKEARLLVFRAKCGIIEPQMEDTTKKDKEQA